MDQTIRPANVAVLVKLQTAEGTPATPDPTLDAIPVEADSVTYPSPWTTEQSNEATGSLVAGSPLIIGQAATISFRSRIKGAGAGATYSSTVKPPLHQALQMCGWKGQFQAAIAAALATAGGASSVTLPAGFPGTARALLGMMLLIGAGTGAGNAPAVIEYTAGRVATLSESFTPVLDTTTSVSIAPNWTYASTSPSDAAARLTDQPAATIWIYEDGVLLKFIDCRGVLTLDGRTARPGFGAFSVTGIYAGKEDAAMPTNLVVANHMAPVLVQGSSLSPAVSMNRKNLAISTWSLDAGSQLEVPDDPNTPYGFAGGQIVDRTPMLTMDPLATIVANRNTISDIGNGVTMPAVLRHGSQAGNRWALVVPLGQPVRADPGTRGKLRSEDTGLQCRSLGRDAVGRDTDRVLVFS
jgi:hypothetical protein